MNLNLFNCIRDIYDDFNNLNDLLNISLGYFGGLPGKIFAVRRIFAVIVDRETGLYYESNLLRFASGDTSVGVGIRPGAGEGQ